MMKRLIWLFMIILAASMLLIGCAGDGGSGDEYEWLASGCEVNTGDEEVDMELSIENMSAAEQGDNSSVTMPSIFASGMVFQRGKSINVWGFSENTGAEIKVTLGDSEGVATVGADGGWYTELPAINEPTWGLTLTVEEVGDEGSRLTFDDIAVGEVWVMSGQSNAQLQVGYLEDVEELAALAPTMENIRYYRAAASFSLKVDRIGSGAWYTKVTSELVRKTDGSGVSAVGYAAAVKLATELGPDVPVAVIHAARGASKIKAWLDAESLAAISPSEMEKFNDCLAEGTLASNAHTQIGTILYNKQIAPLDGYEVAGVMWYQGCGDVSGESLGVEGRSYTEYFTALEKLYRRTFGNDGELPFYVMELAPYTQSSDAGALRLSEFKAEQYDFCKSLPYTYLVPVMAEGGTWSDTIFSQGFIHPSRKSPVGYYTADLILAKEYGITNAEVYSYPEIVSVSVTGGAVTITFDSEIRLSRGDAVEGFELYGASGWVSAVGTVEGDKITLRAAGVTSPQRVRYGFSPIIAELADGRTVSFLSSEVAVNDANRTITITKDGVEYVIDSAVACLRTMHTGNVTNASGVLLPTFDLELKVQN